MSSKRILIVEDDNDLRDLWCDALDRRGYTVTGVGDGAPALDEIARVPPDLILLDLIMPRAELDGLVLLFRLGARAMWTPVPIVAVSELADLFSAAIPPERARTLGIVAVLPKPIEIEALTKEIERIIGALDQLRQDIHTCPRDPTNPEDPNPEDHRQRAGSRSG
jgi:CheY-like chemotaxis protein